MRNFKQINIRIAALLLAVTAIVSSCDKTDKTDNTDNTDNADNGTGIPGTVVNLTATAGDGQVSLFWDEPSDNGGAEITGYRVIADIWAKEVTKTASERTHTCTGLTNGTEYTFKVRAVNVNGAGVTTMVKAMPTGAPGAVLNFTATAGDRQVTLAWYKPSNNGGTEITGYEVTADNWTNKITKTADERSHTYTGLTGGTEYTFKVRAVNVNGAGAESMAKAAPWKLVWEDNFDGTSLDPTKWRKIDDPRNLGWDSDWNRHMSERDELFDVRDGNLILRGMKNTFDPTDERPYLTGGVETNTLQGFQQGRLEICAKLGCAQGAWPAIWMMPYAGTTTYGWPRCGEIDIMEHINFNTDVYQSLHSHYIDEVKATSPKSSATVSSVLFKRDDYNIFAVELYHDSLRFFVNGSKTLTYPRIDTKEEGQFPFDDYPFYLMLDMQLGGSWVGEVNLAHLPVPVEMYIDWVRFYKQEN
ncbi:MAG: fibronectin type III domain-containing protein [Bacteroidales bacterium]|jgi:beta-glucanase (GH16 family)|nr:fibronectin type III domain-containing protein [Bacteroidales bacterium]